MNCFLKQLNGFCLVAKAISQFWAGHILHSLIVVAIVSTVGAADAADELPGQDQALALALENHPDIVSAKAKVALAEAELYGKRMEVTRQVLGLYGNLNSLDVETSEAKASLARSRTALEQELAAGEPVSRLIGEKVAAEVESSERKLLVTTGRREQAERELRLLIGDMPGVVDARSTNAEAVPARQVPLGPIKQAWDGKREQEITLSLVDRPLVDVLDLLSSETGIKFSAHRDALEAAGLVLDMPISLSTNEVPLYAALQALEDVSPQLQFVLRDYGVLLTTEESANEHGYMPVVERPEPRSGRNGEGFF